PVDPPGQLLDDGTLGRSRRAEQKQVFSGHQANPQQIDDFILAHKRVFERLQNAVDQPLRGLEWKAVRRFGHQVVRSSVRIIHTSPTRKRGTSKNWSSS